MYSLDSQKCDTPAQAVSSLTSVADILVFTPVTPVEIISFGVVISGTAITTAASGLVLSCDKRIVAASDTGRVSGAYGTLTLTSTQALTGVVGYTFRSRPAPPTTGEGAMVVLPGQQAVIKVTTQTTNGTGFPFIEYKNLARGDQAVAKELIVTA
jgi:hypothetical protein